MIEKETRMQTVSLENKRLQQQITQQDLQNQKKLEQLGH